MVDLINCTEAPTWFQNCWFMYTVWPFVLTFALVFGVLFKSEILGKNKNQLNAIIAAVIALMFVAFAKAVQIVTELLVFMVVALIILFVFMILLGMMHKEGEFKLHKGVITGLGVVVGIGLAVAVLITTGAWDYLKGFFSGEQGNTWMGTVIMGVVIIGAIAAVIWGGGPAKPSGSS